MLVIFGDWTQEQENAEKLLLNLPAIEQVKYNNLKIEHDRLVKEVESETMRMDDLESRFLKLEQDLRLSPVRIYHLDWFLNDQFHRFLSKI